MNPHRVVIEFQIQNVEVSAWRHCEWQHWNVPSGAYPLKPLIQWKEELNDVSLGADTACRQILLVRKLITQIEIH
jgi:hypothetical protein